MLSMRVLGGSQVRRAIVLLMTLFLCSLLIGPGAVAAQALQASPVPVETVPPTPTAITPVETPAPTVTPPEDAGLGAFAVPPTTSWGQGVYTATAGTSVDMVLTVTADMDDTAGTITIPLPSGLSSFTAISGTPGNTGDVCTAALDGLNGIAGSFTLAAQGASCVISFTATVPGDATGQIAIPAGLVIGGVSAPATPGAIAVLPQAAGTATGWFGQTAYTLFLDPNEGIVYLSAELKVHMVGPITDGTGYIAEPQQVNGLYFYGSGTATTDSAGGTCTIGATDAHVMYFDFTEVAGAESTCTISFVLSAYTYLDPRTTQLDANVAPPLNQPTVTVPLDLAIPVAPTGIFRPLSLTIPEGGSAQGILDVTVNGEIYGVTIELSSDIARLVSPVTTPGTGGAICQIEATGDTLQATISQTSNQSGTCTYAFTVDLHDTPLAGNHTVEATTEGTTIQPLFLEVIDAPPAGVTASFDSPVYWVYPGFSVPVTLTINVPVGVAFEDGSHFISFKPNLPSGTFALSDISSTAVDPSLGRCDHDLSSAIYVSGWLESTGVEAIQCTISFKVAFDSDAPFPLNRALSAHVSFGDFDLAPEPVALFNVKEIVPLELALPASAYNNDIVTVSATQTEAMSVAGQPASFSVSLPAGVTYVPDSAAIRCNPSCATAPSIVSASDTAVEGTYAHDGSPVMVTITFQVRVDGTVPKDDLVTFTASGEYSSGVSTTADRKTLTMLGEPLIASDFEITAVTGSDFNGMLADHLTSAYAVATYSNDPPVGTGSVTVDPATGSFTYTPGGTPGTDSFVYHVTDIHQNTANATVTVHVIEPPVAQPVALVAAPGETITFDLQGVVSHGVSPYAITLADLPELGTVAIDPDGVLTYTANDPATGTDALTYTVTDGNDLQATATVQIAISAALAANPVPMTVAPGETVTYDLNDAISGGKPPYVITPVGQPTQGTAAINSDGNLTFSANTGASGTETFTYQVIDAVGVGQVTGSAIATGEITVTFRIDEPTPPDAPSPTATSIASTTPPAGVTPSPDDNAGPNPGQPSATTVGGGNDSGNSGENGNEKGSDSLVTQLPATGTGGASNPAMTWGLLLAALALLGLSGMALHLRRH
jgi:plastocyanin